MISDDEILKIAKEHIGNQFWWMNRANIDTILAFAHRIAELQRERDAELFDTEYLVRFEAAEIAAAIRARGETK